MIIMNTNLNNIPPHVISSDSEKTFAPYVNRDAQLKRFFASLKREFLLVPHRNDILFKSTTVRACVSLALFALFLASCGDKKPSSTNQSATAENSTTLSAKTVLFFGDSLTAGYGLDDPADAFPGVVQHKIDSAKLPYKVINAGLSGETTAGGKGRIGWILKQKVDIFVLELGANDGLRGIPVAETSKNLQDIVDSVKTKYPAAKLMLLGMQVPPNMGTDYSNSFKAVFPAVAEKNKMALVPFLLKGVGGVPSLNQKDGIHPTAEGAKIVGSNVWEVLKGELH